MYKFGNKENTIISELNAPFRSIPVGSRVYKEEVQPWVEEGNTIEPFSGISPEEQIKINLKAARNKALSEVTVTVGGKVIWANPTEEQNIAGKIREMELEGKADCKWIQGYIVYTLTLAELKQVLEEGTKKCALIYDDYIAAIEAL